MDVAAVNSVTNPKWHPDFLQTIDATIGELSLARERMTDGSVERTGALDAARRAEDNLGYLLVEWEDIPEPAADLIRGVLFETRAVMKVMQDGDKRYGLNPSDNITGRLLDAIKGLEALTGDN